MILVTCSTGPAQSGMASSGDIREGCPPGPGRLWVHGVKEGVGVVGTASISGWPVVAAGVVATLVVGTGLAPAATPAGIGSGEITTQAPVGRGQRIHMRSADPAISADGRFVAFRSVASKLVDDDTNGSDDVFVRDRVAHVTRRVSVGPGGHQANGPSQTPALSAHGRFVAFMSAASNLVAGDTNRTYDVFVRDRVAQVTRRVSVGQGGQQTNRSSFAPAISADGRFIAFVSLASNLVAGDTNRTYDVFVRDRVAQVTRRVSVGQDGQQANGRSFEPAISADGRFVAFYSDSSNLVAGDTNGTWDVFVRDRKAQVTRRVSVGPGGQQANRDSYGQPAISAHGRFVAFASGATNLVAGDTNSGYDVFVRDRVAQVTRRVSVGPGGQQADGDTSSFSPTISAHGRFVTFWSQAPNLVAGDTNGTDDVFVRDRVAQVTRRVSVGPGGREANGESWESAISAHGRLVAFTSYATNLVAGDTNGAYDVFVRDRVAQVTQRVSVR
jgi:Tol biopolymer transport system component